MLRRLHSEVVSFSLLYGIILVHCQVTEYHYINLLKSWTEAQQYCRKYYTDLATIENLQDVNRIPIPSDVLDRTWIGLTDDPASWKKYMTADSNSWKWSATGTTSPGGFQYWTGAEPDNSAGPKWCVSTGNSGWMDMACYYTHSFICYTVQSDVKTYVFIADQKTWDDAQTYCRLNYHDLAMIETSSENQAVINIVNNLSVIAWIGLFRVPFKWSDGNPSTYRHWEAFQPSGDGYCASQLNYEWNDTPCSSEKTFVCQGALKGTKFLTKITLITTADMDDPAIKGTLLKLLNDHCKEKAPGLFPISIILSKTVEETKNNPVCGPRRDLQ